MKGYGIHYIILYLKHIAILGVVLLIYKYLSEILNLNISLNWNKFMFGAAIEILLFTSLLTFGLLLFKMPLVSVLNRIKRIY